MKKIIIFLYWCPLDKKNKPLKTKTFAYHKNGSSRNPPTLKLQGILKDRSLYYRNKPVIFVYICIIFIRYT